MKKVNVHICPNFVMITDLSGKQVATVKQADFLPYLAKVKKWDIQNKSSLSNKIQNQL